LRFTAIMVAADLSADSGQDSDEQTKAAKRRNQVNWIRFHMAANVCGLCIPLTARPSLLVQVSGLSSARSAQLLATFSALTGLVEFLLNPLAGKLSDAWGRKQFLVQAPAVSCIFRTLVCIKPCKLTIALERCVAGACITIGGSTSCSSALADLIHDPAELGQAYSGLGTAAGFGVIAGPMIGGFAAERTGSPLGAFYAGAALAGIQLVTTSIALKETLALDLRKKLASMKDLLQSINPLSFLRLYTHGSVLARLASIASIQCFCEGKSISDLNTYYLLNEAKFPERLRSIYISCFGIVMTLAGAIGKETIRLFGNRGHTTLQNIASILGFLLMGSTTRAPLIFGVLPIYMLAMERRATMSSLAVKAAEAAGMGKGEFSAAFANLRAIAVGIAPLMYAKVYASGLAAKKRSPGRPFLAAALCALVAELMHRTLHDKQLEFK